MSIIFVIKCIKWRMINGIRFLRATTVKFEPVSNVLYIQKILFFWLAKYQIKVQNNAKTQAQIEKRGLIHNFLCQVMSSMQFMFKSYKKKSVAHFTMQMLK